MSLRDRRSVEDLKLNGLNIDLYGTGAMFRDMTRVIHELDLEGALYDEKERFVLPMDDLRWFIKDSRKINWIFFILKSKDGWRNIIYPAKLNQEDALIALFDSWQAAISEKKRLLDHLKEDWIRHTDLDHYYSWFGERDEKKRCEAAWAWYRKEHGRHLKATSKFVNINDILFFLDTLDFSLDAKLLHIEKIKKEIKRQQVRANLKGKKQSNFALHEEVRDQLEALVERYGLTRRQIIERLIRNAVIKGLDGENAPVGSD
ncbi:hypothetical protein [Caballeronia zhejiangensis]|uniref:hypothetical protein n=1 Tax=Caballeronia zhejiangensis TaxID=871203 RepID=UPI001FD46624|nr:hypothetical protein [Caballeronia zhejiangensis]